MNKRIVLAAAITALLLVAATSASYVLVFGITLSRSREAWGQFGDYFGGVLNPLFALLAFLAVLWSIALQERELKETMARMAEQAASARQDQHRMHEERLSQELLHVIRDIDRRLHNLLLTEVSPPGAEHRLTIAIMIAEAERISTTSGTSASLDAFVVQARTQGSLVEAPVREITYLVQSMRTFLEQYSKLKSGAYAPTIVYYAEKSTEPLYLLEYVGSVSEDMRRFFATIGDGHR